MNKFKFLSGDVDYEAYGGVWYRKTGVGQYHVIELINFPYATGCKLEDKYTYSASLGEIDLYYIPDQTVKSACGSCSSVDTVDELEKIRCLQYYGAVAPLKFAKGNNVKNLMRDLRRMSKFVEEDSKLHESRLLHPANQAGSTALEVMQGDFNSCMDRALGKAPKCVSAKFKYGKIPSDDSLAFSTGVLHGIAGGLMDVNIDRKELAEEYVRGFKEGIHIRVTRSEWPDYMEKIDAPSL